MRKLQAIVAAGLLVVLVGCTAPTSTGPIDAATPEQPQGQSLEQACESAAAPWTDVFVADGALSRGDFNEENWDTSVTLAQIGLQAILDQAQDDYRDELEVLVDAALTVAEPETEETGRIAELTAAAEPFSDLCLGNGHEFGILMPHGG